MSTVCISLIESMDSSRRSCFCFGICERHAKLLSSGFHMLAKSVFVFLQSTIHCSSGIVASSSIKHKCSLCHMSYAHLSSLRVHEATHRGRTCARIAVKVSPQLQTCVVTWRSIEESLSSNVTFAVAGFVIHKITRDTFKIIIQISTAEMSNI